MNSQRAVAQVAGGMILRIRVSPEKSTLSRLGE